jgi:hypothetical protein
MPPVNNQQVPQYGGYQQPPMPGGMPPSHGSSSLKWVIVCVILGLLLVSSLIFGFWAFSTGADYKNNSDKKSAVAVANAEKIQEEKLAAEFAEKEKSPYKTYQSSADFGAVKIVYPKTWGAYVDETAQSGSPINGYFHPGFVPKFTGDIPLAIRVQVVSQPYTTVLKEFDNGVKTGVLKASPITVEQVKGVTGMRYDGKVTPKYNGAMVVLPLRDKTLKIWTENPGNVADLNNIILKNLSFSP